MDNVPLTGIGTFYIFLKLFQNTYIQILFYILREIILVRKLSITKKVSRNINEKEEVKFFNSLDVMSTFMKH